MGVGSELQCEENQIGTGVTKCVLTLPKLLPHCVCSDEDIIRTGVVSRQRLDHNTLETLPLTLVSIRMQMVQNLISVVSLCYGASQIFERVAYRCSLHFLSYILSQQRSALEEVSRSRLIGLPCSVLLRMPMRLIRVCC